MRIWCTANDRGKNFCLLNEEGVSTMIEYIIISGILMILIVITLLSVNSLFIERPLQSVTEHGFVDIGNGISTRIVDLYTIAPAEGSINSNFDIPDEVAGSGYEVMISGTNGEEMVTVSRGTIVRSVPLSGIGSTLSVSGQTTGTGLNRLSYSSER
jgi:hypothetical protein